MCVGLRRPDTRLASHDFQGLESEIASSSTSGNETDRIALLDFMKHITQDPFQIIPFISAIGLVFNAIPQVEESWLQGEIPQDVGLTLPNLKMFLGGINNFTGSIPVSLANASGLQFVDFSQNMINGEIVDRSLLLEEEEEEGDHDNRDRRMEERAIINGGDPQSCNARSGMVLDCTVSVLRLGLSCSDSLPSERIPMNIVANKMHVIRDSFIRFQKRNRK
ncbi:hypothetical protein RHSIM_Rhsim05G0210900 [Rhododendron simsii]|uniref:Uncharacterized protein n=1 Tax=Rhododendron simsii TaxID=118357 RepID=A0A834LQD2_RHOSS|nr:hypothetical protein RHSIM_Rhsim05G0210900 [Rhododendron simsii]